MGRLAIRNSNRTAAGWYSGGDHVRGHIVYNHRARTDLCTITYIDWAEDAGVGADHYVIADFRAAGLRAGPDCADMMNRAIGADNCPWEYLDRSNMGDQHSRPDLSIGMQIDMSDKRKQLLHHGDEYFGWPPSDLWSGRG